jgi:hypothetical protein
MTVPDPGVYRDVPASTYHAWEALNQSSIKDVLASPADYHHRQQQPRVQSDPMALGEAVHTLILEPARESEILVCETKTRRGKAFDALRDDNPGACIVTLAQMDTARRMRDAVLADSGAVAMLEGDREVSMVWDMKGVRCKARADVVRDRAVVDVKTSRDVSPATFRRDAFRKWLYNCQAAWYRIAKVEAMGGSTPSFFLVCVQSVPPHHVKLYDVGERAMMVGEALCKRALKTYRDCTTADRWPGFDSSLQLLEINDYLAEEHTRQADEEINLDSF